MILQTEPNDLAHFNQEPFHHPVVVYCSVSCYRNKYHIMINRDRFFIFCRNKMCLEMYMNRNVLPSVTRFSFHTLNQKPEELWPLNTGTSGKMEVLISAPCTGMMPQERCKKA